MKIDSIVRRMVTAKDYGTLVTPLNVEVVYFGKLGVIIKSFYPKDLPDYKFLNLYFRLSAGVKNRSIHSVDLLHKMYHLFRDYGRNI